MEPLTREISCTKSRICKQTKMKYHSNIICIIQKSFTKVKKMTGAQNIKIKSKWKFFTDSLTR